MIRTLCPCSGLLTWACGPSLINDCWGHSPLTRQPLPRLCSWSLLRLQCAVKAGEMGVYRTHQSWFTEALPTGYPRQTWWLESSRYQALITAPRSVAPLPSPRNQYVVIGWPHHPKANEREKVGGHGQFSSTLVIMLSSQCVCLSVLTGIQPTTIGKRAVNPLS